MKTILTSILVLFLVFSTLQAQWFPSGAEAKGSYIELAIGLCGCVGTPDLPPPVEGYHTTPGASGFGLVGDVGKDGWLVGVPPSYFYCGDYVTYGVPIEGFSITMDGNHYINTNVGCSTWGIPGAIVGLSVTTGDDTISWRGRIMGLDVIQEWIVPQNDVFVSCTVKLINDTSYTQTGVYFGRNLDSDGENAWAGGLATQNTVLHQPVLGVSDTAIVEARGSAGVCNIYLATVDSRAVANHGGTATPNALDLYLGTGRTTAVGVSTFADEAIGMGFSLDSIPPGDTAIVRFVYVLDSMDLDVALARFAPPCTLSEDSVSVSACDSYLFNGNVLTASGSYVDTLASVVSGCDSVVHLDLTVNHSATTTLTVDACDSYLFEGSLLTSGGAYTSTHATAAGCDSTVTLNLSISTSPDTAVIASGATLTAAAGYSYQWLDCDASFAPIPGATSQSFTAPADGHYAVALVNGTCADTSACTEVLVTAVADPGQDRSLSLSPNPAHDMLRVSLPVGQVDKVQIVNQTGQVVWEQKNVSARTLEVDLTGMPPGVYIVKAQNVSSFQTQTFVLSK